MTKEQRNRLWHLIEVEYGQYHHANHYFDFERNGHIIRINLYTREVAIQTYGGDMLVSVATLETRLAGQYLQRPHRMNTFVNHSLEENFKWIKRADEELMT